MATLSCANLLLWGNEMVVVWLPVLSSVEPRDRIILEVFSSTLPHMLWIRAVVWQPPPARGPWCCSTFSDSALIPAHDALCQLQLSGRVNAISSIFSASPTAVKSTLALMEAASTLAVRRRSDKTAPAWPLAFIIRAVVLKSEERCSRVVLEVSTASSSSFFLVVLSFLFRLE